MIRFEQKNEPPKKDVAKKTTKSEKPAATKDARQETLPLVDSQSKAKDTQ